MLQLGLGLALTHRLQSSGSAYAIAGIDPSLALDTEGNYFKVGGTTYAGFNQGLTITTSTASTVLDSDGLVKWAAHNRYTQSDDFSQSAWIKTNGSFSGSKFIASATASTIRAFRQNLGFTPASGERYTVEIYVEPDEYTKFCVSDLAFGRFSASFDTVAVTSATVGGANIVSHSITAKGVGYLLKLTFDGAGVGVAPAYTSYPDGASLANSGASYAGDGVSGASFGEARLYRSDLGGMQSTNDATDPTYVPTEGTAVYYAGTQHDAAGNVLGTQINPQATNLVDESDDLTDAGWTKTNATAAKTQTGVGGESNGASLITATAANGTALYSITASSAEHVFGARVKRVTGTGTVEMTLDGGTTWTDVTPSLSTGAFARVKVPSQTLANPNVGFRLVTSGDAIAVQICQCETGSVLTADIPTSGATVTRTATVISEATSSFASDLTEIVVVAEFQAADVAADAVIAAISDGSGDFLRLRAHSSQANLYVEDGSSQQADLDAGAITADTVHRVAFRIAASDFAGSLDGATAVTDTSGTMPSPTTLYLGKSASAAVITPIKLRYIAIYAGADLSAITDAELETASTQS